MMLTGAEFGGTWKPPLSALREQIVRALRLLRTFIEACNDGSSQVCVLSRTSKCKESMLLGCLLFVVLFMHDSENTQLLN